MTEAIVIAWLQFVGAVLAGVIVAVVLGSIIFAAIKTDKDAGDIEQ
jgi:hypothetical protein